MKEGKTSWLMICKESIINTHYDHIFMQIIIKPYNKTILERLREKFPLPDFQCKGILINQKYYSYYCIYIN